MSTQLDIERITTDGGTQARVQLDWVAVSEYAGAMRDGDAFPPIVVFHDGETYWLADGFHRIEACKRAGVDRIAADVRMGTRRDAVLFACGANSGHGVRRTNADKRAAVKRLLEDAEWGQWSDREIARKCGVSHQSVSTLRESICQTLTDTPRKARRNGTVYEVSTANIGRSMAATVADEPEPLPFDEPSEGMEPGKLTKELERASVELSLATHEEALLANALPGSIPESITPLPVVVINADSSRFLAEYVTAPAHLVVTSPPYNVDIDYDAHADNLSTHLELLTAVWRQCHSVMVDGARICVVVPFGVGRTPYTPFDCAIMETLTSAGFTIRGRIVWDKNTTGNRTSWGSWRLPSAPALRDTTECIIVASKGTESMAIPDNALERDDNGRPVSPWLPADYFMELAQDHWVIAPESAQRVKHPAPFPIDLVTRLIHFYAFPGAHILDPFGGSGTTAVAAKRLGCQATLVELSADYCRLAEERINGSA